MTHPPSSQNPTCRSPWYAGLTCDHLFLDCPNRTRAEAELRRCGWWETGAHGDCLHVFVDVHGGDICGMCLHRHNRSAHPKIREA